MLASGGEEESKPDPVAAAAAVVAGYDEVSPLPATERDLLAVLIPMRLCMSVALSAYQSSRTPSNEYLKISEKPAWEALEYLANVDPEQVNRTFREASATVPEPYSS